MAANPKPSEIEITVIIPCLNEAATIGKVVSDFRRDLTGARIFVSDNNSTDETRANAFAAGAEVIPSSRKGKGAVLRHAVREIDAEYYVMVDGDDTCPAEAIHALLDEIRNGADMANGDRLSDDHYSKENKRPLHNVGNKRICWSIQLLFSKKICDVLTGYRVMSRRFVKHCPVLIDGFAVEAEMTIHAIERLFAIVEVPIAYRDRPAGSFSKLDTVSDGLTVLGSIVWLFKAAKPLLFFSLLALLQLLPTFLAFALSLTYGPLMSLWLAAAVVVFLMAAITFTTDLTLDSVVRFQREQLEIRLLQSTRPK